MNAETRAKEIVMNPNSFSIEKLPEGGFVVVTDRFNDGFPRMPVFASADIDDALAFIKAKLTQPKPEKD